MGKYFFDTEFIEHHSGIDLVSIGITDDNDDTFYAESASFDERKADAWVKENVLSKLRFRNSEHLKFNQGKLLSFANPIVGKGSFEGFGTDEKIASGILTWLGEDPNPEFYAYYADYDWVLFCRLFGRMIDLPKNFPMFCIDLKQMMWERGLDKEWKRKNCPDPVGEHNALVDAKWNKQLYLEIIKHPLK